MVMVDRSAARGGDESSDDPGSQGSQEIQGEHSKQDFVCQKGGQRTSKPSKSAANHSHQLKLDVGSSEVQSIGCKSQFVTELSLFTVHKVLEILYPMTEMG